MQQEENKLERIAKIIARSGYTSRRDAEVLVKEGRVKVNGKLFSNLAEKISPDSKIEIDGKEIKKASETKLWIYHKPVGLITTHKDPKNRPTVFENLPIKIPHLISIGRLDQNSEGLLLLTNNGELARKLELPSNGLKRKYRIKLYGDLDINKLNQICKGITIDDVNYKAESFEVLKKNGKNSWIIITLCEGKNREIRRIMSHFNLKVSRLIRISYGPFDLGNLQKGELVVIPDKVLKSKLGQFL